MTGAAAAARFLRFADPPATRPRLVWLVLGGWIAQGASGVAFGAIGYAGSGRLPDIHGIALAALLLKMACAVAGIAVASLYVARSPAGPRPIAGRPAPRCSRSP